MTNRKIMKNTFTQLIVKDCVEYAKEFNVSFEESIKDWEGDGPQGSWGLTEEEEEEVLEAYNNGVR